MLASIPSPEQSVWFIGPFPLRAYAVCIVIGIFVAIKWGQKRWVARGGSADDIINVAMFGVPSGIVGGRLYHVVSDWQIYFGENGRGLTAAFRIWDGGLGIWGAIALGFVGCWVAAKKYNLQISMLADALAPGVAVAQAIGRFGNYFNQELFGAPTTLPWGLEIDPMFRPDGYEQYATFHPTFLYEALWCLALAFVLVKLEKRYSLAHGQVFALYVLFYTL
ncbi:MAG: Phosphatidylglycerol--prolipoprotein diacylglyceryl transferase, partial [Actinomycetota bacterium]